MKFTILRNELNEAIQHVSKAVASRATIPILSGIKIDAGFSGITLTASDTDISIQSFIPLETAEKTIATVVKTGSVVLTAKFFVEIVKKLPHEEVHIEVGERFQTMITSGATEIQLVGLDPEEFPVLPSLMEEQVVSIPGDLLRDMIRQTVFAVTTNESTPILTGVLWNLHGGLYKFVATDRHRLASRQANVDSGDVRFSNIVISGKTLNELSKIVPDQNVMVDIVVAENQVLFKLGNVLFYSRMLDGTYPDTSKIIPQNFKTELVLNTKQLSDSIDRAYLLSREEKTNIVRLVTTDNGGIEISSSSSELGKVTEQLSVSEMRGEPLKIAFNSKYMLDVLKVIDSEELFIGFNGSMSPIIIRPSDHENSLHLILPYRTTN
ncbi:DNA polymerase III subunit beta [Cohnella sp. CIP 111063]|jgi:DNA polymerase-3 subunit beta|uniref:DNA polymerase III subunit beta n=1 Tax=unclassified Cohnella TaxID=2636738 RepID=UPI000B8C5178|nr:MULTISPECIES: DNA polymerase III subunit beta [unclassified Cohnella]OXS56669.1 DNA polymerase III subunit beta [Cohnella sp. CIP 111063]PRX68868.1 DNA polymerase III beta subunit [Cohnella sp. SGD-V74]